MSKHAEGQYVISGGGDFYWFGTSAKTLRGAKCVASKTYSQSVGGKIEVARVINGEYVRLAVKRGFDNWQD